MTLPFKCSIVVASAQDGAIGINGKLPWHLPADLQHFKKLTLNKPILMGRKTFESLGRTLPGRPHIVVSRQSHNKLLPYLSTFPNPTNQKIFIVNSVDQLPELLSLNPELNSNEVMLVGGAQLYSQCLVNGLVSKIYKTEVYGTFNEADAFFKVPEGQWQTESASEIYESEQGLKYRFLTLVPINKHH